MLPRSWNTNRSLIFHLDNIQTIRTHQYQKIGRLLGVVSYRVMSCSHTKSIPSHYLASPSTICTSSASFYRLAKLTKINFTFISNFDEPLSSILSQANSNIPTRNFLYIEQPKIGIRYGGKKCSLRDSIIKYPRTQRYILLLMQHSLSTNQVYA